jgi:hypothetical protein
MPPAQLAHIFDGDGFDKYGMVSEKVKELHMCIYHILVGSLPNSVTHINPKQTIYLCIAKQP